MIVFDFSFTNPHENWILGIALEDVKDEESQITFKCFTIGLLFFEISIGYNNLKD